MKIAIAIVAALVILIGGPILGCKAVYENSRGHVTITVKDKEPSTGDNPYRVFTTDGRTFSVEDSMTYWDFRASDRYGQIDVGKTYTCLTEGWRVGFLSAYPNLLKCEAVR